MKNQEIHAALRELKRKGKVKFTGVDLGGPEIESVIKAVIEMGAFDVVLCPVDSQRWNKLEPLLKQAKAKGIGVLGKRVLEGARGANLDAFKKDTKSYAQAALRWALSFPVIDAVVVDMPSYENVQEYVGASVKKA